MGRVSRYPAATFCSIELLTADVERAQDFYRAILGWQFERGADGSRPARRDGLLLATLRPATPRQPAHWLASVAVDDPASVARRAVELGGSVSDGGGAEQPLVVSDPWGARFGLRVPGDGVAQLVNEIGTWNWNELVVTDLEGALTFYSELFGWQAERADGPIQRASLTLGNLLIGGVHAPTPGEPPQPRWDVSFRVADTEATVDRAQRAGGRVLMSPLDVPIGRLTIIADPAGTPAIYTSFETPFRGVDASPETAPETSTEE